jgi:hypothetical protein
LVARITLSILLTHDELAAGKESGKVRLTDGSNVARNEQVGVFSRSLYKSGVV